MLKAHQDAYGHMIYDYLRGRGGYEIDERDDGYVAPGGVQNYFVPYKSWPSHQKKAVRCVVGRVLDVGCGAGRWALHLQERGHRVVGIDNSPLAVKTCRARGVRDARVMPFTRINASLGKFDTVLMMGNNFGLFASYRRARWLLRCLRSLTNPAARIVAESNDPYATASPVHLAYHKRNKSRGRMGGQVRIRIRYLTYRTPWFDYLLASRDEMKSILEGTGWHVRRFLDSKGSAYVAVIEKE